MRRRGARPRPVRRWQELVRCWKCASRQSPIVESAPRVTHRGCPSGHHRPPIPWSFTQSHCRFSPNGVTEPRSQRERGHNGRGLVGNSQMGTGSSGRSDLRPKVGTVRPRRRRGSRRHLGAAGIGLRRAGRPSARDGFVHVHRVPRRLCGFRTVPDPRPRAGFIDLTPDLRRSHAPAGRWRRAPSHCAGGDAGGDRRHHRDRTGDRPTGFRRRSALE